MIEKIKEPKSTKEKTELARKLIKEFQEIRETKDKASWYEGRLLYYFKKFGLRNYLYGKTLSNNAFYAEIDIPASTAEQKIDIYSFYVVENGFKIEDLMESDTRKLHRAIIYIRDKSKDEIKEAVEKAKRGLMSFTDYLISLGAEDKFCVHEPESKEVKVCKKCGKTIKK